MLAFLCCFFFGLLFLNLLLLSISTRLQYSFSYCDTTATATSPLLLMELTKLLLHLSPLISSVLVGRTLQKQIKIYKYKTQKNTYLFDCCLKVEDVRVFCFFLWLMLTGKVNANLIFRDVFHPVGKFYSLLSNLTGAKA